MVNTLNTLLRRTNFPGREGFSAVWAENVGNAFARHSHEGYVFGLMLRGARRIEFAEGPVLVEAGAMFALGPRTPHACAPDQGSQSYAALGVPAKAMEPVAVSAGLCGLPAFPCRAIADPALARLLEAVLRRAFQDGDARRTCRALDCFLRRMIDRHADPAPDAAPGPESEPVRRVKALIARRCPEALPLDELASLACLSPFHFQRRFLAEAGTTPHEFHMLQRVRKAADLLASGLEPAAAAVEAGFSDQSHLNRMFKKLMGVPPGRYAALNGQDRKRRNR